MSFLSLYFSLLIGEVEVYFFIFIFFYKFVVSGNDVYFVICGLLFYYEDLNI